MHITLTNRGTLAVPFSSSEDKGFVMSLDPGIPYAFDNAAVNVANIGDNPSFVEELKDSIQNIWESLVKLITVWRDEQSDEAPEAVSVSIENHGPNALRVLLGVNTNEVTVSPGTTYAAVAPGYIEIRELGV